ncbi:nitronate monooxygenase [Actinomadura madurae]|uniref:nitronate monooxygenase n=2 Tax=Actinomadura madurae TaxID=1993 RepID=UPI002026C8A8|nr:nitronate monooxygenase [Actinomadura madurae]URN01101.1 nitronate monooxygenase [Actinomadura madurae]
MSEPSLPHIVQGGMGAGVSGWRLARAVARTGQLGVVSGVALDALLARGLQAGDKGGDLRRALAAFPLPDVTERILRRYYVPGGIEPGRRFRPVPKLGLNPNRNRDELTVAGNFAEVWLAKQGHDGPIGINYLEKIQLATPAAAYGATLAGVDYILMGAGIPSEIPALLDSLAAGSPGNLTITVAGADDGRTLTFDPASLAGPARARPRLLAIVSSSVLAMYLHRSPATRPDGFVLETAIAGGHSAPPRGRMRLDNDGEPIYGHRDRIDPAKVGGLGLPFWVAGGYARPGSLAEARSAGATGIQAGSIFALSRESGLDADLRRRLIRRALDGTLRIRNDPHASPTGFPFKVAVLPETLSEDEVYDKRSRLCDMSYLRTPYLRENGAIGYRCPAEPVDAHVRKGGTREDTVGRRCLCNALVADIGHPQHRPDGYVEPPLLTLGQDLGFLPELVHKVGDDYSAADAVDYLLGL